MDYLVTASDGKEYGPVTFDQLREWVSQDRVRPDTTIKNFHTGQLQTAAAIPGLFGAMPAPPPGVNDWSQPPAAYPRTGYGNANVSDGKGELIGAIIRSAAAVLFFFVLHGIGLIFGIYALIYAFRCKSMGNKYGTLAIVIASVAFVSVLIGWFIRMQGGSPY